MLCVTGADSAEGWSSDRGNNNSCLTYLCIISMIELYSSSDLDFLALRSVFSCSDQSHVVYYLRFIPRFSVLMSRADKAPKMDSVLHNFVMFLI